MKKAFYLFTLFNLITTFMAVNIDSRILLFSWLTLPTLTLINSFIIKNKTKKYE